MSWQTIKRALTWWPPIKKQLFWNNWCQKLIWKISTPVNILAFLGIGCSLSMSAISQSWIPTVSLFGPRWISFPGGKIYLIQSTFLRRKHPLLRNANEMPCSLTNLSPLRLTQIKVALSVLQFEQGLHPWSQLFNRDPITLSKCQNMYVLVQWQ